MRYVSFLFSIFSFISARYESTTMALLFFFLTFPYSNLRLLKTQSN